MIEPEQGFAIDDADYRWGTTPGDIPRRGPLAFSTDYLHLDVPCRAALGFQAAGMTLSAPASDRPVMNVSYELAPPAGRLMPAHWMNGLRTRFGPPDQQEEEDRHDSSSVAYWASWSRPTIELGLSIYGDVRDSARGRSAGLIYVRWTDTAAAAAPYRASWREATAALERAATTFAAFNRFDMPMTLTPAGDPIDPGAASFEDWRALNRRTLLRTPASIGARLSDTSFAIWQSAVDGLWALSTPWDTVILRPTSRVSSTVVKPAKGGGRCGLSVGGLSVFMPYGTKSMASAAAALKALPGLDVEETEDYDA